MLEDITTLALALSSSILPLIISHADQFHKPTYKAVFAFEVFISMC